MLKEDKIEAIIDIVNRYRAESKIVLPKREHEKVDRTVGYKEIEDDRKRKNKNINQMKVKMIKEG